METRKLGNTDLQVSVVGLGTWALGGDFFGRVDDGQSVKAIQEAIDSGINLVDTAPAYGAGHSEEIVGRALRGRRDRAVIATKVGVLREGGKFIKNLKPESIRREIDDSLRRLQVDVIDLYQVHWPDPDTPLEESLEELARIREAGKFRYLGVSNFGPELMDRAAAVTEIVSLQPHYSLLRRDIEQDALPYCRERGLGVLSYGTLAGGILTGKFREIPTFEKGDRRGDFYDFFREPVWSGVQGLLDVLRTIAEERERPTAQVAIRWAVQQPGVTTALVGAKNPQQARSNAGGGNWELSSEELRRIDLAWREHLGL
ncbi:MAG: aldo/keto reductase [Spirochaetota bacterium]